MAYLSYLRCSRPPLSPSQPRHPALSMLRASFRPLQEFRILERICFIFSKLMAFQQLNTIVLSVESTVAWFIHCYDRIYISNQVQIIIFHYVGIVFGETVNYQMSAFVITCQRTLERLYTLIVTEGLLLWYWRQCLRAHELICITLITM